MKIVLGANYRTIYGSMAAAASALRIGIGLLLVFAVIAGLASASNGPEESADSAASLGKAAPTPGERPETKTSRTDSGTQAKSTTQLAPLSPRAERDGVEDSADDRFMLRAIELSRQSFKEGGNPFGAVVVKNGRVIGEGMSKVVLKHDPTAHAEVTAIRAACQALGVSTLEGCEIYSSAEPCPMCLATIYWARMAKVYYGNTIDDTARIGIDDKAIYEQLAEPIDLRSIPEVRLLPTEALKVFKQYNTEVRHEDN